MTWIDEAREAIMNSSEESIVYIGADSVRYKKGYDKNGKDRWFARYSTVIVLHINGRHGCKIFHNTQTLPDYGSIETRLLTETQMSIDAFSSIEDVLGSRRGKLEIHLDVNPDPIHASNVVAKQAAGWVRGLDVIPRIKNEAWAASTAADYLARNGQFKLN